MSIGTGIQPETSLGSIDVLKSSLMSLLEMGKRAQNLADLLLSCVSIMNYTYIVAITIQCHVLEML